MSTSVKALKATLKKLNKQESRASTWLLRLTLVFGLAGWAFEQWVSGAHEVKKGKGAVKAGAVAGKQALVWVGGGCVFSSSFEFERAGEGRPLLTLAHSSRVYSMGVVRLLIRWYFVHQRTSLGAQLLASLPPDEEAGLPS